MGSVGTRTAEIAGERRRLINVAYRLLGSVAEAEDAVQDAYARWYGLSQSRQEEILSPGAWLTTVTGRICLDLLGSARARRERYVGAWLPEPLPDRTEWDRAGGADPADPADQIVLDESVAMAFLVVLESMTPAERVAFVLHDVFRYPFAEIAGVLGRTPAACKQLAASARRRVDVTRAPVPAPGRADVVRHVKEAWETKDIAALVGLLDPAAVMTADGGGMVGTVLRPVEGGARIARYMVAIADKAPGLELLERSVNG
ncbi:sigma-70 family RNA polymerase sigma factor, partial [Streptomyces sp. NPDC055509]